LVAQAVPPRKVEVDDLASGGRGEKGGEHNNITSEMTSAPVVVTGKASVTLWACTGRHLTGDVG
jgi:hypothetical protein